MIACYVPRPPRYFQQGLDLGNVQVTSKISHYLQQVSAEQFVKSVLDWSMGILICNCPQKTLYFPCKTVGVTNLVLRQVLIGHLTRFVPLELNTLYFVLLH